MKRLSILAALLLLAASLSSLAGTIDVVSLGAKNDGSEDVSAIVNANTARGPLFFPAGIYKVSHPLVLKNSIRGEGFFGSRPFARANEYLTAHGIAAVDW